MPKFCLGTCPKSQQCHRSGECHALRHRGGGGGGVGTRPWWLVLLACGGAYWPLSGMLNLMTIPHVLHMKEIIPTSRRTNDCGGHMFTGGPDVRNSNASNSNIDHD